MLQTKTNFLLKILKVKEHRGLCLTCKNSAYCTFARNITKPVLQCEEFEGYVATPKPISTKKVDEIIAEKKNAIEYKGLCVNCENREDCTYSNREGGVWHCDEYV